jgi:hypothetical protein
MEGRHDATGGFGVAPQMVDYKDTEYVSRVPHSWISDIMAPISEQIPKEVVPEEQRQQYLASIAQDQPAVSLPAAAAAAGTAPGAPPPVDPDIERALAGMPLGMHGFRQAGSQ